MRLLNSAELDFVVNCPAILNENVIRPYDIPTPIKERISLRFEAIEPFLDNIYIKKNEEKARLIYWFAYIGKVEKMSNEEITSYIYENCPFKVNAKYSNDIAKLINDALK